jgi:hypothetical protein
MDSNLQGMQEKGGEGGLVDETTAQGQEGLPVAQARGHHLGREGWNSAWYSSPAESRHAHSSVPRCPLTGPLQQGVEAPYIPHYNTNLVLRGQGPRKGICKGSPCGCWGHSCPLVVRGLVMGQVPGAKQKHRCLHDVSIDAIVVSGLLYKLLWLQSCDATTASMQVQDAFCAFTPAHRFAAKPVLSR